MKIMLPEGYEMPASAQPGEPFEAVATLVIGEDGMVELVALDGVELGEGVEEAEEVYADPEIELPFENA
jgi:hypothetical protein